MRLPTATVTVLTLAGIGCTASGTPAVKDSPVASVTHQTAQGSGQGSLEGTPHGPGAGPVLPPAEAIPPDRRVWAYIDGERKVMDIDDARSFGLTIVDLSDDWVPYIFWSQTPGEEDYSENEFLDTYVDLANDRVTLDGVPPDPGEKNYLEVYGIPPTLSVLRERFLQDDDKACYNELDYALFENYHGPIRIGDTAGSERELRRYHSARAAYKKALRDARVRTLEQLKKLPRYKGVAANYEKYSWRHEAIRQVHKRLACEGLFGKRSPRAKSWEVNWAVRDALRQFERKHNVFGWGMVFQGTSEALGRNALQSNYDALVRVLTERVVSAARVIEDGTISKATYKTADGQRVKVRNLVEELGQALVHHLGLTSPKRAMAFMKAHRPEDFSRMLVAVKLPELPEYYKDPMDLSVVIDRGDIWYDIPFTDDGRPRNQPRRAYPHLILYTTHQGQRIPLVRWRTTIGGWQPEIRNDQEYYKFKISDVGPRVWKHIIAGPVWVPPDNTPSRDKIKIRNVRGRSQPIVAHQTFGPGYASAYGLVAAFHVTRDGRDNQVRTHGSVNYMSILSSKGFSHGCHRLFNQRAVRLFSYVLAHREFERKGQSRLSYSKRFEHRGEEFHINLTTRGYYYEMTPPIPVNVLEGNIRGELKKPVEEYVKKPGVVYQEDLRKLHKKGPTSAPRVKKNKTTPNLMRQPQNL